MSRTAGDELQWKWSALNRAHVQVAMEGDRIWKSSADEADRARRSRSGVGRTVGGPSGLGSSIRPAGRSDLADDPLDEGIRPESNTGSGDPGEVVDGEANIHPGNPRSGGGK